MPIENIGADSDKVNHLLAFVVFTFIISQSYEISFIKIIILGLIFAIYIEVVQYFIPYRSAELFDIFADFIGIILGLCLLYILSFIVRVRKN
jgi:VanZ family protein